MPVHLRPRRLARAALTVALTALVAACAGDHPNSIFHSHTEFNREVGTLFDILIWLGTAVFIFVEAILVYTLIRYRKREGQREPEQVHGNTKLEILWTVIPAVILVFIAIPTVRTIFRTQAKARADALQVEVIGHQWWWEFRYPQYGNVVTANELYLPLGRTVNFTLKTQDVLHSFWIPQLGGKRDLIANHTNYLWFTADSLDPNALNGFCAEYCGASHANMRFRAYTVTPADFEAWAAHQQTPAAFTTQPAAAPATAGAPATAATVVPPGAQIDPSRQLAGGPAGAGGATTPSSGPPGVGVPTTAAPAGAAGMMQAGFVTFPIEKLRQYNVPRTPLPAGLTIDEAVLAGGDAARGADMLTKGIGGCLGCHMIKGNPSMVGVIGPNLTHIALRHTIGAGLYPNDPKHLALWIKNSRAMKPGVIMPTLGQGQIDPLTKKPVTAGGLTDQQIADIVAYLQALK